MNKEPYTRALPDIEKIIRCKSTVDASEDRINGLADLFHVTGNSVRLTILHLLNKENRLCVCDLADVLEMTIPAVSQHLKKLKHHKLIDFQRDGSTIYYSIAKENKAIVQLLLSFIDIKTSSLHQLV